MKKVLTIILLGFIGFYLFKVFYQIPYGINKMDVGNAYVHETVKSTGAANVVTAIVVNYRGFDTLGEVTVLFLASTGLSVILYGFISQKTKSETSLEKDRREKIEDSRTPASIIVKTGTRIIYPLVLLLGAYVFIHGHLTPGGGFQGGAIIATGVLMLFMAFRSHHVSHSLLVWLESLAGLTFVSVGMIGLILGKTFLENYLPIGKLNDLFSAGIIPIIYIAVGFKVGAELTGVLDALMKAVKEQ